MTVVVDGSIGSRSASFRAVVPARSAHEAQRSVQSSLDGGSAATALLGPAQAALFDGGRAARPPSLSPSSHVEFSVRLTGSPDTVQMQTMRTTMAERLVADGTFERLSDALAAVAVVADDTPLRATFRVAVPVDQASSVQTAVQSVIEAGETSLLLGPSNAALLPAPSPPASVGGGTIAAAFSLPISRGATAAELQAMRQAAARRLVRDGVFDTLDEAVRAVAVVNDGASGGSEEATFRLLLPAHAAAAVRDSLAGDSTLLEQQQLDSSRSPPPPPALDASPTTSFSLPLTANPSATQLSQMRQRTAQHLVDQGVFGSLQEALPAVTVAVDGSAGSFEASFGVSVPASKVAQSLQALATSTDPDLLVGVGDSSLVDRSRARSDPEVSGSVAASFAVPLSSAPSAADMEAMRRSTARTLFDDGAFSTLQEALASVRVVAETTVGGANSAAFHVSAPAAAAQTVASSVADADASSLLGPAAGLLPAGGDATTPQLSSGAGVDFSVALSSAPTTAQITAMREATATRLFRQGLFVGEAEALAAVSVTVDGTPSAQFTCRRRPTSSPRRSGACRPPWTLMAARNFWARHRTCTGARRCRGR